MVNFYINSGVVSMEDSMDCPKCGAIAMKPVSDYWVCANQYCGYQREVKKPILTQAELLNENEKLRETIAKLVEEISHRKPH